MKSEKTVQRERLISFIKYYQIRGRVIARLLGVTQNTVSQKKMGNYLVTKNEVDKLKIDYYLHLSKKRASMRRELERDNLCIPGFSQE